MIIGATIQRFSILVLALTIIVQTGCGMLPAKKPDIGPAGAPAEGNPNPPILERFSSPPAVLYDIEAIAGTTFSGINKEDWPKAEAGLSNLQQAWLEAKQHVGDKKGVKEADEALGKLATAISAKEVTASYEALNKFMGSIGDIGKSYKLSPLTDLISVDNSIRNVSFYLEDKNWLKAGAKAKELDDVWSQAKPGLERFGVLGEITKTHSAVKRLRDAVGSENKGSAEDRIADLNASMARIRDFYRGK